MVQSCSLNSAFHGFRIIFLRCESAIGLDEKITRLSVFFLFQTTLRLFHHFPLLFFISSLILLQRGMAGITGWLKGG